MPTFAPQNLNIKNQTNMSQITFTMIKPDAVANGHAGKIINDIIEAGFTIVSLKYTKLSPEMAGKFYAIHKERGFFNDLVSFMSSGPIYAAVLQKEEHFLLLFQRNAATMPSVPSC